MDNYGRSQHNGLGVAGLICGILTFLTSFTVVLVPLGAGLAFAFGFLSRGDGKLSIEALLGIIFAVLAVIAAAGVFILIVTSFPGLVDAGLRGISGIPGRLPGML